MFNKILIANRGEIACRIIKTARRLGIETVAVYSTVDRDSLHVSLADHAFCIGGALASDSYLNIDAIISAATQSQAQAIHPGYGFLSENQRFATACEQAGITFIGPSISAMQTMGSKQLSKQLLEHSSVPLIPGYHGVDQSDDRLQQESIRMGFPVLLKAANGGGGKGMRIVNHLNEFQQALAAARRESMACFGDDTLLVEKLILNPRHIEMQIMADNHGQVVHLFERDCSIQRRHQKIIEEAPAPGLSDHLRQQLADAAITISRLIQYRGAGTIEFLVDTNEQFYFMEMNTRLQVEHPVTEMITGLDLVEWQLQIADNQPLPLSQTDIKAYGHAIECRIYAEDPAHDFIPSIGQLHYLRIPEGPGIRIDSGVQRGSVISMHYDPMIAKLITWGATREDSQHIMNQALKHYHIGGVKTNLAFLQSIINHPQFIHAQIDTGFLQDQTLSIPSPDVSLGLCFTACADYLMQRITQDALQLETLDWQPHLTPSYTMSYWVHQSNPLQSQPYSLQITPLNPNQVSVQLVDQKTDFDTATFDLTQPQTFYCQLNQGRLQISNPKQTYQAFVEVIQNQFIIYSDVGAIISERYQDKSISTNQASATNAFIAPMPATVVAILKKPGDSIQAGECLMVLEAMKMEHTMLAHANGIVAEIFYNVGDQVSDGAQLATLEAEKS